MDIGRNSPHVVVNGRKHGNGFLADINAGKYTGCFRDSGKSFRENFRTEMFKMQVNMIDVITDAPSGADFHGH